MSEHPNVQRLRAAYSAFETQDTTILDELFGEDVVWHVPGETPISGTYEGRDVVFGFFVKAFELTGGTFRMTPHEFFADDNTGIVVVTSTAERGGQALSSRQAHVYRFDTKGQVAEFSILPEDAGALTDFWS